MAKRVQFRMSLDIQSLESEHEARASALVDSWMEYKIEARHRIDERRRRGLSTDDIKPHPDDVMVDVNAGRVWFCGDIWPDDAARIRELGLGSQSQAEHAPPANDDEPSDPEHSAISVPLGNVLEHLDFEPRDAVQEAYTEAREALTSNSEEDGPDRPAQVNSPASDRPNERSPTDGKAERGRPVTLAGILDRLEPEYHDPLRRALATEKSALARLLRDVPWPRPTYAGIPAEQAASLVRLYSGEKLKALERGGHSPNLSERSKERARAALTRRLAQLRALQEVNRSPTTPKLQRTWLPETDPYSLGAYSK